MKGKIYNLFYLLLIFILATCLFTGCKENGTAKASVLKTSNDVVVIKVDEVNGDVTLLSVMQALKEESKIDFNVENGMITKINGVQNPSDFSACWMLFTSDTELANSSWGTFLYEEQVLGSAITGAEELLVIEGAIYVWNYKSF
jgi:hypothetical protein